MTTAITLSQRKVSKLGKRNFTKALPPPKVRSVFRVLVKFFNRDFPSEDLLLKLDVGQRSNNKKMAKLTREQASDFIDQLDKSLSNFEIPKTYKEKSKRQENDEI